MKLRPFVSPASRLAGGALFIFVIIGHPSLIAQSVRQTLSMDEPFRAGETVFWTPAFQKCWDELVASIGLEALPLRPETKYVKQLNDFQWDYEATVPRESHLVLVSGTGEQFRERANRLLMKHFGRAVPPLDENYFSPLGLEYLGEPVAEAIILSVLKHDLIFEKALKKYPETFSFRGGGGSPIEAEAFGSFGEHRNVYAGICDVLHYGEGGSEFALSFPSQENGESLILVRSEKLNTVDHTIEMVGEWRKAWQQGKEKITTFDTVLVPSLEIDHYEDMAKHLSGVAILGPSRVMAISRAGQRIQCKLDEKGSSMKTAAFIVPPTYLSTGDGGNPERQQPNSRRFVFDRPFQMMLWREGADIPFFFARIESSAIKRKLP